MISDVRYNISDICNINDSPNVFEIDLILGKIIFYSRNKNGNIWKSMNILTKINKKFYHFMNSYYALKNSLRIDDKYHIPLVFEKYAICNGNYQILRHIQLREKFGNSITIYSNFVNISDLKFDDENVEEIFDIFRFYISKIAEIRSRNNLLSSIFFPISLATNLTILDMRGNNIKKIPNCIGTLTKLETLDLRKNKITKIPDYISYLRGLKYLNLQKNKIRKIPDSICNLTKLEELILSTNKIKIIPDSICNLSLNNFDVDFNQIKEMGNLNNVICSLFELSAKNNRISNIPNRIFCPNNFCIPDITFLDFGNNMIDEMPNSIQYLTNLESLFWNNNRISEIPESIFLLKKLVCLDLGSNKINVIPDSISLLTNLNELDLSSNKISTIPKSISYLQDLFELDLHENRIKEIPESFCNLKSLGVLNLGDNEVCNLPIAFSKLNNLGEFDLSDNGLLEIPPFLLMPQFLKNLEYCDLSSNNTSGKSFLVGERTIVF